MFWILYGKTWKFNNIIQQDILSEGLKRYTPSEDGHFLSSKEWLS
jgi:hypothetical protein